MKKHFLIFLAVLLLLPLAMASCSKESDNESTGNITDYLIGKWGRISMHIGRKGPNTGERLEGTIMSNTVDNLKKVEVITKASDGSYKEVAYNWYGKTPTSGEFDSWEKSSYTYTIKNSVYAGFSNIKIIKISDTQFQEVCEDSESYQIDTFVKITKLPDALLYYYPELE